MQRRELEVCATKQFNFNCFAVHLRQVASSLAQVQQAGTTVKSHTHRDTHTDTNTLVDTHPLLTVLYTSTSIHCSFAKPILVQ